MIIFIINDVLDIHLNNMVEIRKKLVSHYDTRHVFAVTKDWLLTRVNFMFYSSIKTKQIAEQK